MPVGPAAGPRRSRSCGEARRGGWLGSIPYAGIADDSEAERDRPIKCCDAIHSISHYPPVRAMRGERCSATGRVSGKSSRSGVTRTIARTLGMRRIRSRQPWLHARAAIHLVTQLEAGQCTRGREALRPGREPSSGWNRQTCRTESA
ncbi:hypothetical protein EVG18_33975 [Burkholderia pyrrocinia]|nr:hypothetical protein EVG18_33975 [Burkholderia pyrrocinia]